MRGPFLPLYGSGAIMMLVISMPFQNNTILVCLSGCVGALTILMTEWLHKPVEKVVLSLPETWLSGIALFLTAVVFADFALSFKAALDLRDVLIKMEKAKEEMLSVVEREHLSGLRDIFQRRLLRSHPTMTSRQFREALEELKKRAEEWKRK